MNIAIAIIAATYMWSTNDIPVQEENDVLKCEEVSLLTRDERTRLDELERKVGVLYAAHTNRLVECKRTAVERVMENTKKNRKRKSAVGRSAGGVR